MPCSYWSLGKTVTILIGPFVIRHTNWQIRAVRISLVYAIKFAKKKRFYSFLNFLIFFPTVKKMFLNYFKIITQTKKSMSLHLVHFFSVFYIKYLNLNVTYIWYFEKYSSANKIICRIIFLSINHSLFPTSYYISKKCSLVLRCVFLLTTTYHLCCEFEKEDIY